MLAVGADSSWIQGDAVCLGCGRVVELIGVPVVASGRHEICTSACRDVLEKLCVRNDFLCAQVKELQLRLQRGDPARSADAKSTLQAFSYTEPSDTALRAAPLRHPSTFSQAGSQTSPDFKPGDHVLVRDRPSESWRPGVFLRYTTEQLPLVRVRGLGELVWGHISSEGSPSASPRSRTPSPRAAKRVSNAAPQQAQAAAGPSAAAPPKGSPKGTQKPPDEGKKPPGPQEDSVSSGTGGAAAQPKAEAPTSSTLSATKPTGASGGPSAGRGGPGSSAAKPSEKKDAGGSGAAVPLKPSDIADPSELRDMVKTIAGLKLTADRLQTENTRLTTQLNKLTSEKAALDTKLETVHQREQTIEVITKAQGKQSEELHAKAQEAALLKAYSSKLQHALDDSHTLVEATLQREISSDSVLGAVVSRLQNLLRTSSSAVETRKMAATLLPRDFRRWIMSFDTHPPYRHSPHSPAGGGARGAHSLRTQRSQR